MTTQNYFCLLLKNVRSSDEELVTEFCFSNEAQGISENLDFTQDRDDYEPVTTDKEWIEQNVYFDAYPGEEFLQGLQARFPDIQVEVKEEEVKDWLEEWKKGFKAFDLVANHWVVPSWLEAPEQAVHSILIDPGMAFGTGTHETTRIAAHLLHELCQSSELVPESLVDIGTGTGILSILAKQLGVKRVLATEINEDARRVARENVVRNQMADIEIPDEQVEALTGEYSIVVANIIDGVLLKIKSDLKRLMAPGGYLLLTGILEEREARFIPAFDLPEDRYELIKREQTNEWVGLLYRARMS